MDESSSGFCDINYHHPYIFIVYFIFVIDFICLFLRISLYLSFWLSLSLAMLDCGRVLPVDEISGFCDSNYHHQHHQACQETQTHGDVGKG